MAIGLSADCFTVALGGSISMKTVSPLQIFRVSLSFGFFQALMPLLGWATLALWSPALGLGVSLLPMVVVVLLFGRRPRRQLETEQFGPSRWGRVHELGLGFQVRRWQEWWQQWKQGRWLKGLVDGATRAR